MNFSYYFCCSYFQKNFPGCELENVAFPKFSKFKGILFTIYKSFCVYLFQKLKNSKQKKLQNIAKKIEKVVQIFEFVFFFNFLRKNGPIDFSHWLFNIKYDVIDQGKRRFLDNEYLNKTMVWNYLIQSFLGFMPVLQKTIFPALIKRLYMYSSYIGPFLASSNLNDDEFIKCCLCGDDRPSNPVENESLNKKMRPYLLFLLFLFD